MQSVRDVDAFLLITLALASKRRPAELAEIMAAADLTHGAIPYRSDLTDAFYQLATHGLIREAEGRFPLTPGAEKIMARQPRKADKAALMAGVKDALHAHPEVAECAPVLLTELELSDAIAEHRDAGLGANRNRLMPSNKVPETRYQRARLRGKRTSTRGRKG